MATLGHLLNRTASQCSACVLVSQLFFSVSLLFLWNTEKLLLLWLLLLDRLPLSADRAKRFQENNVHRSLVCPLKRVPLFCDGPKHTMDLFSGHSLRSSGQLPFCFCADRRFCLPCFCPGVFSREIWWRHLQCSDSELESYASFRNPRANNFSSADSVCADVELFLILRALKPPPLSLPCIESTFYFGSRAEIIVDGRKSSTLRANFFWLG